MLLVTVAVMWTCELQNYTPTIEADKHAIGLKPHANTHTHTHNYANYYNLLISSIYEKKKFCLFFFFKSYYVIVFVLYFTVHIEFVFSGFWSVIHVCLNFLYCVLFFFLKLKLILINKKH